MEVGAVKQAFNNEVILLKKNLNQAKIQIIHKLTRKAKTLAEKKCPDPLKEKLKKKAESAVKEVLLIKKIKPRDIARFIVTHKGKLNDYLNKPNVDNDKACARLLLHKALTSKYQLIKDRFGNVSIKDLFMSRQERRQLKKEEKEKQQNKKKKRANSETDNVGGVWDVEVNKSELNNGVHDPNEDENSSHESGSEDDNEIETEEQSISAEEMEQESDNDSVIQIKVKTTDNKLKSNSKPKLSKEENSTAEESDSEEEENIKTSDDEDVPESIEVKTKDKPHINDTRTLGKPDKKVNKVSEKRLKDNNKNKNLNEKLKKRKFNKDLSDPEERKTQIVDPFFITSSGENYMSLVEPRQPDVVKEVHKQGNRKYRRAVMFGHVPKPRRNDFRQNKYNQQNDNKNIRNDFKQNDNKNMRNDFESNANNRRNNLSKEQNVKNNEEAIPEKLHPSWEAKKRQSTILPFKGKKIMFDDS